MKKKIVYIILIVIIVLLTILATVAIPKIKLYQEIINAYSNLKSSNNYKCIFETGDTSVEDSIEVVMYKDGKRYDYIELLKENETIIVKTYTDFNNRNRVVISENEKKYEIRTLTDEDLEAEQTYIPEDIHFAIFSISKENFWQDLYNNIRLFLDIITYDVDITSDDNYNFITIANNIKLFISKETNLIERIHQIDIQSTISKYSFEVGTVTEADVSVPDLTNYIQNN